MNRLLLVYPLLACSCVFLNSGDVTEPRNATVDAAGAQTVYVEAAAGTLRIEGRDGLSEVRIQGTAGARRQSRLDDVRLVAERRGDEVRIVADLPRGGNTWLDLVIEVPRRLALRVDDGAGSLEIFGTGPVDLVDGSGSAHLEGIAGDLHVNDGSGSLRIHAVDGDVRIDEDGSGSISISRVRGSVHIHDDGSGSIDVDEVGGDLIVDEDGSGSIDYRGVKGRVRVPS